MWIAMFYAMSGTRPDGSRWPAAETPFEVEDWEGDHLIRGQMAYRVTPLAPEKKPAKAAAAAQAAPAPAKAVAAEPVKTAEPAPEEPSGAPSPSAARQVWVDYALSQGAQLADVSTMTKADLQSKYGGRL